MIIIITGLLNSLQQLTLTYWFKLLQIAPLGTSTNVILQPTLNGLFFFYIRMYKWKTISELHQPKTSFATASRIRKSEPNLQGFIIQSFFNILFSRGHQQWLECHCTNKPVYQTNKAPCLPSLYFSSTVTVQAHRQTH